jgi:hypothetical protein
MKRVAMLVAALVGLMAGLLASASPASASGEDQECMFFTIPAIGSGETCPIDPSPTPNPVSDRMMSARTGWWTYQDVPAATVATLLQQNHARPTDLRVVSQSPLRFSVTMVANSGVYRRSYWWYYGVSKAQVNSFAATNDARLISAVRYGSVYAVVMVPNVGADHRDWDWADTDFAGVGAGLDGTNRLTNIVSYAQNRFVVIFVDNREGHGWCWYAGISRAALSNVCNGQSILDISANPDGTFNVASVAQGGDGRVHDFATPADLENYARRSPPDRPLFVTPYADGNATRWITSFRHNS